MKGVFRLIVPILLATLAAGCPRNANKPEIIFLITLDTTRADSLDYTPHNAHTPHFAQLAQEGFYHENAYTLIPITLPSHASMFYSQPPHRLKIYNNGQPRAITLPSAAQILKSNGYKTGAVISLGVLKSEYGVAKGFDEYIENFSNFLWMRPAHDITQEAINLINRTETTKKKATPSFYWIHYSDPHEPYFPPVNDGWFAIRSGNSELYRCRSVDQPAINLEITLVPGTNTLNFETSLPSAFNRFPQASFKYLKYRDFSVTPVKDRSPSPQLDVRTPSDWAYKVEKEQTHYYTSELHSVISISNPSPLPVKARLTFVYGLFTDEESRKTFYREEVKYMDAQFGVLLDYLKKNGLYEKSAFVVVGDHGEGLGEYHNHYGHIHYLNQTYTRVPLLVAGCGVSAGAPKSAPVSTLDIAPTLLDLADVEPPDTMLGHSLLSSSTTTKTILMETYSPEAYFDSFALVRHPWQIIFNPGLPSNKLQFYRLDNDPAGVRDLNPENGDDHPSDPPEIQKIRSELVQEILKISRILTATKGKIGKSTERHREILKSLGYL